MNIDLENLRAELQRKIEAVEILLGGNRSGDGIAAPKTYAKRRPKAKAKGRNANGGSTTNEVILKSLASGKDVATRNIIIACVKAGKSKNAVSVAINALRKKGKVKKGSQTGFWKRA